MPDLSILVELADYYDIEIKELLDGERSSTMNKEMKETLDKVADYEDWVKQKALKAGNLAFGRADQSSGCQHKGLRDGLSEELSWHGADYQP